MPSPIESRLAALCSPAIVPGLERTRSLLKLLGNPERKLKVIHVAGSNGKGSVCRMIESVLLEQGLRTGLFISPHLVDFTERFRVAGKSAKRSDLERAAKKLWPALRRQAARPEGAATYFEALTVLAFLYFKGKVDLLVLETGLGGRLDSTNVVAHPLLTLITNISLEHTQILGGSESAIAFEKAGIIKAGSPLVCTASGRARGVILKRFKQVQGRRKVLCLALRAGKDWRVLDWQEEAAQQTQTLMLRHLGDDHLIVMPLLGAHQHENLAAALAALKILAPKLGLEWPAVARGLAKADWPARLQVIGQRPLTLLDGAHNPAGAEVLADYVKGLRKRQAPTRVAWVLGVLKDKDWRSMMAVWVGPKDRAFVARPPDARGLDAGIAVDWFKAKGRQADQFRTLKLALREARRWAGPQGLVLAAGSLYNAGILLKNRSVR